MNGYFSGLPEVFFFGIVNYQKNSRINYVIKVLAYFCHADFNVRLHCWCNFKMTAVDF
jgi:hypothetical protein